jgi:hypothetical protein
MTRFEVPSWVPNWRDATAYTRSFTEDIDKEGSALSEKISTDLPIEEWPLQVWIWEFLRRNTEYQADYKRFATLPTYYPGGGKTSKLSGQSARADDDTALRYCDPAALPGETVAQYWARLDGGVIAEMPLEEHLMEKWCITNLPDPAKDDGYFTLGPDIEVPPHWLQIEGVDAAGYIPPMPVPDEIHHVTLRFDLRYSIDKQFERAKEYIKFQQEYLKEIGDETDLIRATGPQLHKLPLYLRAFDADCAGATLSEIGKVLFPEKRHELGLDSMRQSAYSAVKEGKELVSGGYKDLIRFK